MSTKTTFSTIDAYIAQYPDTLRQILTRLRTDILANAPGAQERMSWQMPTFHLKENLVHFAVHKNHIGFYPGPDAIVHFADRLKAYKTSKGAVQLPLDQPMPYDLLNEITRYRVAAVMGKGKKA